MKVQIITNLYPLPWEPNRAAFNRQQFQHLSALCPVRVTVLIPWLERIRHRKTPLKTMVSGNLEVSYCSYFYIPVLARCSHAVTLLLSLFLEFWRIRHYRPDCMLMSWAFPDGVAGTVIARLLGLPAVIKIHGSDINMHLLHESRARQILWSMKYAQHIVSVSKALASRLVESGVPIEKIRVIYNGVDKDVFKPITDARHQLGLPEDRDILLYVGNLKQEKGCVDLIDAFAMISKRNQKLHLYYIGTGREESTLSARILDEGLETKVTFLGSLGHDKLSAWVNAATILALPSYNEGVPNVLLEAMACGTPVVATEVGGIPEIVPPQAGILTAPGDVQALAVALEKALSMDWNRGDIVDSVSTFDWNENVGQLFETLTRAVSAHTQAQGR